MIKKLLIANRGEIACRIIKTAKKMGITTVAIFSEIDQSALHVRLADEAFCVGSAASNESYLNIKKIIEIATLSQVDAIHPGYGFLSENPHFAAACLENDIIFIGPSVAAITAMGSKSTAKTIMEQAQVPLVPGYHGDNQDPLFLQTQATQIGFPILIKAASGGGGKGMRVVEHQTEFLQALQAVQREALAYFADDKVLLEKYLTKPRHIEIQIIADSHDNYLHLFERDCSIQRRHQKIIEEAPAPNLPASLKTKIAETAIAAAKAINYVGAGTVEFLVDDKQQYYFMEMNTRLQVEHPVTEMITGIDLVAWQIDIAAGKALPLLQQQIQQHGHAIEVRLYAEDPFNQFLPSIGTIQYLNWPGNIRIDTGFQLGDEVSSYYDPMLAKLIAWGEDRNTAINIMQQALTQLHLLGVKTNVKFLLSTISHLDFMDAQFDTGFIELHQQILCTHSDEFNLEMLAKVALFHLLHPRATKKINSDPYSPWHTIDGWRANLNSQIEISFKYGEQAYLSQIHFCNSHYQIIINDNCFKLQLIDITDCQIECELNQRVDHLSIVFIDNKYHIFKSGQSYLIELFDPLVMAESFSSSHNSLTAPMPGTIIYIGVGPGDKVSKGTKLITMEAMKMEHSIFAQTDGTVTELLYQLGDMVNEGAELLLFEAEK